MKKFLIYTALTLLLLVALSPLLMAGGRVRAVRSFAPACADCGSEAVPEATIIQRAPPRETVTERTFIRRERTIVTEEESPPMTYEVPQRAPAVYGVPRQVLRAPPYGCAGRSFAPGCAVRAQRAPGCVGFAPAGTFQGTVVRTGFFGRPRTVVNFIGTR